MSLGTRRLLFYIFVVVFLILGTIIVLYSQGWRFDFQTGSFQVIGGVYINSTPSDASITLDGKPVKNQSGLLQSGTLISELVPGSYYLTISDNGYTSWAKTAEVKSSEVTVFDNIILLPTTNSGKLISKNATGFTIADGQLLTIKNGSILFNSRPIPGARVVASSQAGRVITSNNAGTAYHLVDLSNASSSLNLTSLLSELRVSQLHLAGRVAISKIAFNPFDDSSVIINATDGLYVMDTTNLQLDRIATKVADFAASYDQLIWADNTGLWRYNLVLNATTTVLKFATDTAISPVSLNESPSRSLITVINRTGKLYLFDAGTNSLVGIANSANLTAFSGDSKYIAFGNNDGKLSVYNTNNDSYITLINSGPAINSLKWYKDNSHLFVLQGSDLSFIEVASGTPVNSDIISHNVSQFDYNAANDTVYYVTPEGLFSYTITN
ncbi:MAG: PEGA domain-containing protein [Patescibacteria group bacterium]|nr:PEGA domain-containing protein [Patescibacteria group bacterium]MCL5224016.1 PEGA domain-containing protein [Patescibacteria group bacterium]